MKQDINQYDRFNKPKQNMHHLHQQKFQFNWTIIIQIFVLATGIGPVKFSYSYTQRFDRKPSKLDQLKQKLKAAVVAYRSEAWILAACV